MNRKLNEKNYIKKYNLNNFLHLQIPRKIWEIFLDKKISPGAFKIYVEFFDRLKLSAHNNWIDENNNVYIKYSYEEIMDQILKNKSRGTVTTALTELKNLGLIIQEKGFSTSSKFYLTNILNFNLQKTEKRSNGKNKVFSCDKKTGKQSTKDLKTSQQKTGLTVTNNNYSNHTNKIITTTKRNSSSELNSIKEYLDLNKVDKFTENNILRICEEKHLNLKRVEEVFNYSINNKKGFGYVVKALKYNWKLNVIKKVKTVTTEKTIRSIYEYAMDYKQFNYSKKDILDIFDDNTRKYKDNDYVKKYRKKIEMEE